MTAARPRDGRGRSHLATCYMLRVQPRDLENCDCGRVTPVAAQGPDGSPEHQFSLNAIGWGCYRTPMCSTTD